MILIYVSFLLLNLIIGEVLGIITNKEIKEIKEEIEEERNKNRRNKRKKKPFQNTRRDSLNFYH